MTVRVLFEFVDFVSVWGTGFELCRFEIVVGSVVAVHSVVGYAVDSIVAATVDVVGIS